MSFPLFFCLTIYSAQPQTGTLTGNDGRTYKTVRIGNQVWMAENLLETQYRDGSVIPKVAADSLWESLSTGAYCAYENDESKADTCGYLYNWNAVGDSRHIAPEGWRVPTDEDWQELEMYLGMSRSEADRIGLRGRIANAGGKLKSTGGWKDDGNGTDETGFSALPGGYRLINGAFSYWGGNAFFWSATASDGLNAWSRNLYYHYSSVYRTDGLKRYGFSVRLIREGAILPETQ